MLVKNKLHEIKDVLLLDNQSTADMICNREMLQIVKQVNDGITMGTPRGNITPIKR